MNAPTRGHRRRRVPVALITLILLVAACGDSGPYVPAGLVRTPYPEVGHLALPESTNGGTDFAFRADPNGLLIMYFGYTGCPDICPTTLADVRSALRQIGDRAERVDVAFATIDPGRDDDSVMTAYTHAFFAEGHGLRTDDPDLLATAASPLGVSYSVAPPNEEGYVEVVHSAWTYVIDDQGRLLLMWPFGTEPEDMARDLKHLFKELGADA
jgi:protein SCO1/2